jgi:hypothetical protein
MVTRLVVPVFASFSKSGQEPSGLCTRSRYRTPSCIARAIRVSDIEEGGSGATSLEAGVSLGAAASTGVIAEPLFSLLAIDTTGTIANNSGRVEAKAHVHGA